MYTVSECRRKDLAQQAEILHTLRFTWKYPTLPYLPLFHTGPRPTSIIYKVQKNTIDILTRDQVR